MANILQDIWIVDFSGIVLYHRAYNKQIDVQLFGGLMSALNKLAEEISEKRITRIDFENKCFGILKKENFLFIANADEDIGSKTIIYELKLIAYKFLNLYREVLNSGGLRDISAFYNFTEKIEDSLMYTEKKNTTPIHGPGKNLPEFSVWIRKIKSLSKQESLPIPKSLPKQQNNKIKDPSKLEKQIITLLKKQKVLKTQLMIVDKILPLATNQNVVITAINNLKEKKVIKYSKRTPKGWRLAS
ncbi:MAG: hypothetical protein ACFFAH_02625 [Promethearchaeota archaeon]